MTHTTAFVTPVVEHWLEREIAWKQEISRESTKQPYCVTYDHISEDGEREGGRERGRNEMFYLITPSTHFIYCYMATDGETRCHHFVDYCFRLAASDLLYIKSHRQDSTYHDLCYTSC